MSPPRPKIQSRSFAVSATVVLMAALALRLGLLHALDLRDLPGAGAAQTLFRAQLDLIGAAPGVRLARLLGDLAGDDVLGARIFAVLSSMAMVVGAMLGGGAVGGRRAALGAGIAAGTWTLAVQPALLVGPDPAMTGLAWLGVGLAWAGARLRWPGVVLVAAGAACVMGAASLKSTAFPAAGLVLLAPLLATRWRYALAQFTVLALVLWQGWALLSSRILGATRVKPPALTAESLLALPQAGVDTVRALPGNALADGTLDQLLMAAAVGALVPGWRAGGARWWQRLLVGGAAVLAVVVVAGVLGPKTRPRYLTPVAVGAVVLAGVLVARISDWLPRYFVWVPAVALGGLLLVDTWAWVESWDRGRSALANTRRATLPRAPEAWARRHREQAVHGLLDLTIAGAAPLGEQVATSSGVATLPLRDQRYQFLLLSAMRHKTRAVVLHPRNCCGDRNGDAACAQRVVSDLDAAGIDLALPVMTRAHPRIDRQNGEWMNHLTAAAQAAGGLEPEPLDPEMPAYWWRIRKATGTGGPMPCTLPGGPGVLWIEAGGRLPGR